MTPEEVQDLINKANELRRIHPALRQGQALTNILWHMNHEAYNQITGTEDDPFYVDERVDSFLAKIQQLN